MAIDTKGDVFSGDLTKLSEREMFEQAEMFSEGSPTLRDLMVLLWSRGIQTIGSCSGHQGEGYPYISFFADKMTDAELRRILTEFSSEMKEVFMVNVNKGRVVENSVYNENGEIVGKETFKRPFNISVNFEKDKGFDANCCYRVIKDALENNKSADYYQQKFDALPEEDKLFIEDIVSLKNTDFSKVDLSHVKHFPNDMKCDDFNLDKSKVGISYENGLKNVVENSQRFEYVHEYDSFRTTFTEDDEAIKEPCKRNARLGLMVNSNAYSDLADAEELDTIKYARVNYTQPEGKFIVDKESGKVIPLTDDEIKEKGLISMKEYQEKLDNMKYGRTAFSALVDMAKQQVKDSEQGCEVY